MKLSEMSKTSASKATNEKQKSMKEAYDELKDCSSDELFERLKREIQVQKSSGAFDYEGLRASIEKIKQYLPTQTYENMIRIIENLK